MGKDRQVRAVIVFPGIERRIDIPALHGSLRSQPHVLWTVLGAIAEGFDCLGLEYGLGGTVKRGAQASGRIDSLNSAADFVGAKCAILIIKTIGGAIGCQHIELYQVNMLAKNV